MNEQPKAPLLTPEQLALIAAPVVQSLLYDCNLLPESLLSLDRGPGHQHWAYLLAVLGHFEAVFRERDEMIAALRCVGNIALAFIGSAYPNYPVTDPYVIKTEAAIRAILAKFPEQLG